MVGVVLGVSATASYAQSYNAFTQFSLKSNPAGQWSYVAAGALLTVKANPCNGIAKDECWLSSGGGFPNVAAAEANKTGTAINYADVTLPAQYLDFDPQGVANVGFRWTAPKSGSILVAGNFLGVAHDEGSHTVAVEHNAVALKQFTVSAFGQRYNFKLTVPVRAGDTISFLSFTGNGGGALSTGLRAKITYQ